jgi:hypothetical protein
LTNDSEHPAVQAWSILRPRSVEPRAIEALKNKPKSAVYRLAGAGPNGAAIVAKRCLAKSASVERIIYEEVLPALGVPALSCYGFVEEPGEEYSWLFLEDASGQEYSPRNEEHRATASRWLAALHSLDVDGIVTDRLPARGTGRYLQLAQSSRATASEHLANPVMNDQDLAVLQSIASECKCVESHWSEVEGFCQAVPQTLVHGDLVIKNVRIRNTPKGLALLVFDWENAGWGIPAADLAQFTGRTVSPDLGIYSAGLPRALRPLTNLELQRLAAYGRIFRLLDDIHWASSVLVFESHDWIAKPISYLRSYVARMAEALRLADWD